MSLDNINFRARNIFVPANRRRWLPLAAVVALAGAVLHFFWKLAFSGLILARGDTFLYFYPYWEMARNALAEGRLPLWNFQIFMGAPFLANSQAGFFYPLNWPLWLLLPTPYAISASIVLHVTLAAVGCYVLARRELALSVSSAFLAAGLFALGGYLTAQVEHVNQLQGLAWMPWLLAAVGGGGVKSRASKLRGILWAALVVSLQLLAGHTQSVFVSAMALAIFRVAKEVESPQLGRNKHGTLKRILAVGTILVVVFLVAALLAAVQIMPTFELSQLSGRQGGLPLNEAVSFSLHPLLLTQSLLPWLEGGLFTEYVAFLPLSMLLLAFIGAWHWRRLAEVLPPLALAVSGLFLALGRFNPVYLLLAQLPGFDLFRAPARWMALYALGMALLAGVGLDLLRGVRHGNVGRVPARSVWWAAGGAGLLILWGVISVPLTQFILVGSEASAMAPSLLQIGVWLLELVLAIWLFAKLRLTTEKRRQLFVAGVVGLPYVVLFLGSRNLPYNRLTTAEAYFGLRPPVARLQALQRCDLLEAGCQPVTDRLLSLSDIFFDPGDMTELASIYEGTLTEEAFYDYVVAVKQKEIVAPNLPMIYGLASVDGFDGGVLPLRDYGMLMRLILPDENETTDGRLREYLDAIPDGRWLDLFGARYILTDKVGDEWRRGVYFDTQHAREVVAGEDVQVGYLPGYEATEIWVLGDLEGARARVTAVNDERWTLESRQLENGLWHFTLPEPATVESLVLSNDGGAWALGGMSLVDDRDGTFHSIVPRQYRLIYSGDVKIYENLDVLPRAFVVPSWRWRTDVESSVAAMSEQGFDPAYEAVVQGEGTDMVGELEAPGAARITSYQPEEIVIEVSGEAPGLLVVTEAHYPGWEAAIDGEAVVVQKVNGLFRGVMLPAGEHEVRLSFRSRSFEVGLWITLASILGWVGLQTFLWMRQRR